MSTLAPYSLADYEATSRVFWEMRYIDWLAKPWWIRFFVRNPKTGKRFCLK